MSNNKVILIFVSAAAVVLVCTGIYVLFTISRAPTETVLANVINSAPEVVEDRIKTAKFQMDPHDEPEQNQANAVFCEDPTSEIELNSSTDISGPLRVHGTNPRYFSDTEGKAVLLTGSHTWSNFIDNGGSNPPPEFDYTEYLDFLVENNHNFFRLWSWEQTRWTLETSDNNYWFNPMPFQRTGPGSAIDGEPKFDLMKFNQSYFDRLRSRVIEAGERGIYVSITLFNGWSTVKEKESFDENNPWRGHPFNASNNINGINGDPNGNNSGEETHELRIAAVTELQEAYVRKVIDTVNDLDNVLYEISNESHSESEEWQYHMINFIKQYESTKFKKHPVGMSVEWPGGNNGELFASPADWISPSGDINNPPVADGSKVILSDSDHLCGVCGDRSWVWKSFTRGENPVFMDGYDGAGYGVGGEGFVQDDPVWVSLRKSLGYARVYAERLHLSALTPRGDLCSTGYCLAKPTSSAAHFLVYLPDGGSTTIDLSSVDGDLSVEWLNPETGEVTISPDITGGAKLKLTAPFSGDAVLYLYQVSELPLHKFYIPFTSKRNLSLDQLCVASYPFSEPTKYCRVATGW